MGVFPKIIHAIFVCQWLSDNLQNETKPLTGS